MSIEIVRSAAGVSLLADDAFQTQWWQLYKAWEALDSVAAAFQEQRLTVKGTALTWDHPIEAQTADNWGRTAKYDKPKKSVSKLAEKFEPTTQYPMKIRAARDSRPYGPEGFHTSAGRSQSEDRARAP